MKFFDVIIRKNEMNLDLVPYWRAEQFSEVVFDAYEEIAEKRKNEAPFPYLFDDIPEFEEYLEQVTSVQLFGDEGHSQFTSIDHEAEMQFHDQVDYNKEAYGEDLLKVLHFYHMSFEDIGIVFNTPIRKVW